MTACTKESHPDRAAVICSLILIPLILTGGCVGGIGFTSAKTGLTQLPQATPGNLNVYFLDVGQGDSTLVLSPNRTILIDAGDADMGGRVVSDLRNLGVTQIDLLVATHPHSDHIGGMQDVLAAFPVNHVLDSGMSHPSPYYESFLDALERNGTPYIVAEQGQIIDLDPAFRITVLNPPANRTSDGLNQNSIITRITYGTVDFLFTGDAGVEAESALLTSGYPVDAEVLKVAHHGSSDATCSEFLSRIHPEAAILSVGADNPYGHPHRETLGLLDTAGVSVYRTDRDGTILVSSDGSTFTIRTMTESQWSVRPTSAVPVALPAATTPVATNEATPAVPVRLVKVQFNAPGDDRFNLNGEYVVLANEGNETVLLTGWTLSDSTGSVLYTFPAFLLFPDEMVTIFSGAGRYNNSALFMGKPEPVWGNDGDVAVLKDLSGTVIDRKRGGAGE